MKRITIIAAVLALCLTACSFFTKEEVNIDTFNGTYQCQVTLTGGSGKATVSSPAEVVVAEDNKTVKLVWSSSHYDYMLVDGVRFENEAQPEENSVFTIPFKEFDVPFSVIGDTTAMSTSHEIEYEITVFNPDAELDSALDENNASTGLVTDNSYSLGSLVLDENIDLGYAKEFKAAYYKDGDQKYLFVIIGNDSPEYFLFGEAAKPAGISANITYINQVDKTYLVSTSVMDLIAKLDALDNIRFSGTDIADWYVPEAKAKMKSKDILYAGKYSAPDYELLISKDCNLAIENTMIYHNPEVKEKLISLGIPVMVERSSYETNPLGRLEWIKLYGLIYNRFDEANAYFEQQKIRVEKISGLEDTGKTVAIFSINSNGMVTIRKPKDYLSIMVDMAGGKYVPSDIDIADENALSTVKITMEDFYIEASEADVLIYNSTIEGEIDSIDQLLLKADILGSFKAVEAGQVYCLDKGYFQQSGDVAEFIEDVHIILNGEKSTLKHIYKLKE